MSIDVLQQKDLFSHKFKYVGLGLSLICIIYALFHHFVEPNLVFTGLHATKILFGAGLIIAISSQESSEDERVRQIRANVHYVLSYFFIGIIFYRELGGGGGVIFDDLLVFLTVYLLVFNFIYYYGADWIVNNKNKFWFLVTVLLVGFLILFDLLWAA
jgi:hypothetical protein